MFRAQANPMDDAITKATDENLTSENWEYIIDVCDRVTSNSAGPQQATASLIKRLAHRNANVQLYTLELANALSQNCGPPLHRELASKAFTDALLRLAADRNTHAQVKQKILERMGAWTEEFKSSAELGIMEQAYHRLRVQQPGLMPPSKPVKREISSEDKRKEEEELQMALELSIKDKGTSVASPSDDKSTNGNTQPAAQAQAGGQQGTTAATVSRVRALYDFTPSEAGELAFRKNDIIAVLESVYKDWWKGSLRGQTGIFPLNYVEKLQDPTKEELERDAQMEAEVFGEIKNVEKLLALLSVRVEGGGRRGEKDEDEISELYQRTLSIRPKLIELIARYSQKKDDFTQLNEKFIKARRDYEALLESSMSQPQYRQQYPIRQRQPNYPPQHPQPYGAPQQAPSSYPQGPPSAGGYPPQQQFAPPNPQHLPPPQQDPQRYYSPAPSDPPPQATGFQNPYPPQNGPPPAPGPAPFHFIPGGIPGAPSPDEARRKPSPNPVSATVPSGPYSAGGGFQGQIRPNSIHTLNSGNPQELATSGYESPVDNRHSYPSAQQLPQPPPNQNPTYDTYNPQAAPPPAQPRTDRDGLPSRQRTQSFESPTSLYSTAPDGVPYVSQPQQQIQPQPQAPPPQQAQPPPQPSGPPPAVPQAGGAAGASYQAYLPYVQPQQQQQHPHPHQPMAPPVQQQQQQQPYLQQTRVPSSGNDSDPGNFYR